MPLKLNWKKVDAGAKSHSDPSISDLQDFSNLSLLLENVVTTNNLSTVGELNQTILDDSQIIFPKDPSAYNFVLWSKSISDANGEFTVMPTLIVPFSQTVTSSGVTIKFWEPSNDYCSEVTINWYDSNNNLLSSKIFYPNSYEYFCSNLVTGYSKVVIQFNKTASPYRFVKVSGVEYGEKITLSAESNIEANLLESIGLTSERLYTNTLNCSIMSLDETFNMVRNPGLFTAIQTLQQIKFSCSKEGELDKVYGTFFINAFELPSGNEKAISLDLVDLIGVLENIEFIGGLYENVTFGSILAEIKSQAHTLDIFGNEHDGFDVPESILSKTVTGYIPITNCREALHMLLYATNTISSCNRGEKIKIFERDITLKETIGASNIVAESYSVKDNQSYTGVSLNAFIFTKEADVSELSSEDYQIGTHKVTFFEPKSDYTISGGTIVSSGANFVEFSVAVAGRVSISGKGYSKSSQPFTAENTSYTGNAKSIKQLSDIQLVHPSYAQSIADAQLSYYTQKYKATVQTIFIDRGLSDQIRIKDIEGSIKSIETDLISEDISQLEVIGNARTDL